MKLKEPGEPQPLKRLNFDVPEQLAHEFKAYAAMQGKTQRELVIAFMQRCVSRSGAHDPGPTRRLRKEESQHG